MKVTFKRGNHFLRIKNRCFITLLLLISISSFAQLETSQWHFSNLTALNFNNNPPTPATSSMNPSQRCAASVADSAGNLLFYTNGVKIWNKNHVTMTNGATVGPSSNIAASQAALIFPKSGKKYYVVMSQYPFLNQPGGPKPVTYCIVDMAAANGLGSVIQSSDTISQPNVRMITKLAGTKHCNGTDYWLLAHETSTLLGSQNFHAYQVTPDSIYSTPIISAIGSMQVDEYNHVNQTYPGLGILKFSPNGKKVCSTFPNRTVELFDFDNATGQLSNVLQLESINSPTLINNFTGPSAYGIEFSPDGSKLYVSYLNEHPSICQYDLSAGSATAIIASKTIIAADTFSYQNSAQPKVKALQLALDGKIYLAEPTLNSIGLIANPNALGTACNYSPHAIALGTLNASSNPPGLCISGMGLPCFISSYFEQKPAFTQASSSVQCGVATFSAPVLSAIAGYSVYSYHWNFGDPSSGASNTSGLSNPAHLFSANGTFTVKLVLNYKCGADTLKQMVTVSGLPSLSLTTKSKICLGENALLNFSGASSYSLNGSVTQASMSVQPTLTTTYTLSGTSASSGCQSSKVFTLTVSPCTGLERNMVEEMGVMVYPNPSDGIYKIQVTQNTTIKIVDLSGRLVYNTQLSPGSYTLDLCKSLNGLYVLEAQNEYGLRKIKLVKQ
ncbi:hypothetical protein CNR22_22590 [Sphingobacteriaceae bacterium]|nr:hypothetical protein CNR22_22590 [Sphingobacteriaceae bacterium]